ncbi:hypothetical protein [Yersinia kristensenii]|uniref:hypothetical protein n=1 Tax=Yersinia kristensenii TaxID=28152 RepID=UPI001427C69F|nr:hypothetical protein [Yersinia kristensenii]MDA5474359.1 hypothetical protein [Yersinia kristensenii]MDA5478705.1 hypothetical protein [Yersinia kristensenii]MDA5507152.1 hypothetical protein [Yersinia kristensenii]NIK95992.1 hypothetical protein [Yersinia kristensenii]NIL09062.1 hypothetical protein [Yersinia kristensenii]
MKTSTSRRCNWSTPGAAVISSCSALVIPDSVSQSPPIISSPFSRTQVVAVLAGFALGFSGGFVGNDSDPELVMLACQL